VTVGWEFYAISPLLRNLWNIESSSPRDFL
jgi:hypothetical protein